MAQRIFIRDMEASQYLEGVFAVQNCQLGQTKNGKPFLKCLVADSSARVPGRMWNITQEMFDALPTDGFAKIKGQTQPYQGEMQIIINGIKAVTPSALDLEELLPCTQYNIDEMFAELVGVVDSFENDSVKALAQAYLQDEPLMERFKRAPAAMSLHHAYIGGLLEHTLSLLRLGDAFCPLYPKLNRDIVMMGLLLHDIGKCMELTWESGFGYSDDGQLVGHIARGVIWLQRKAEDCRAMGVVVPEAVLMVLHHIILSHHGKPEFGALKLPSTPEAIAVSLLDNADAKLQMALANTRPDDIGGSNMGGNFTEKIWALETRLYKPDPTTIEDEPA